ncbi:MAG: DEAD/DEAH box helicase [Actinobacteria bacterium]|nr:DEAD/DEAH box helicase [Actinomycetota bacterium]
MLDGFHPAVRTWFARRFPDGPSEPQAAGWPAIAARLDTLIAAPTGSGKTLAAFLVCIDRMYRAAAEGHDVEHVTRVVYVSPLKALGVDIQQNLETPLREIAAIARELGDEPPPVTVAVRSGDTPSSARAAMVRRPPTFLITTPESLYLLLTAERSRETLRTVDTVIVDEIHAVARDKRGSHLALTLERLAHVCSVPPVRIGLSATQRPISAVARLLVGAGPGRSRPDGSPRCQIVDCGHRRHLDLGLELPEGDLEAVASAEQLADIYDRIAAHVRRHRTTLVFVNTRRMAERVAYQLAERLGDDQVAAHHGSLSKDRRLRVETRLRAGELRALVATASLELGIDIGPVELVCQIGSPRSLATFVQRVGRSGHRKGAVPVGRIYPTTRDELVECAALLAGVRAGRLDAIVSPQAPLDIVAQQVVAECAAERWREDDLFALVRGAAPFASLDRHRFDEVVELVSEGIQTGRGRRGAYVHRDRVNGELGARRGARLAALTSGGAIPEVGDYRVLADPDDTLVGTVNEDWAIESMAGDVFCLGTHSWRIRRVEPGVVRVVDAGGASPTVPFWLGEAPARTEELSEQVSVLREEVGRRLDDDGRGAVAWLRDWAGIDEVAAAMVVRYLGSGHRALGGVLPTLDTLVFERFFDEAGGMQLVVHSPYGGRVNRGFGLALRKRFCVRFDFELQAAASDDAVVLSLGPQHSFPLADVARFLHPATVQEVLSQAVLDSPMFTARWRWNLNRALAVLRFRGGKKNPLPIQRMEADDLMAAVFPALAACQENVTGPRQIPDHPLVRQTLHDCLHEAMDIDGLIRLLGRIGDGSVRTVFRDSAEPSPLAHEILNGRPFTFLDDAPLEERRTRAVPLPRGLPVEARDLGRLDTDAIDRVRSEVAPDPRSADELHDLLLSLVTVSARPEWEPMFAELEAAGRAWAVEGLRWCAVERRPEVQALFPGAPGRRGTAPPRDGEAAATTQHDDAAAATVRGHLDVAGPVTVVALAETTGLSSATVASALAALEAEGFVLRGAFDERVDAEQFCARRLLARVHGYTRRRRRGDVKAVPTADFLRFLLRWQHVLPGSQLEGRRGVLAVVEQLQGFEAAAGSWEASVLATRVGGYQPEWLDRLCLSGEVAWGRLGIRAEGAGVGDPVPARRSAASPSRATPLTFAVRDDLPWLLQAARGATVAPEPEVGAAFEVLEVLRGRGASFRSELGVATGRLPTEVEGALWDLVARGLLTADSYAAVRALFSARRRWEARQRPALRRGLRQGARMAGTEGRWALLPPAVEVDDGDELAEAVAEQLLARWGVVFRDLLARENLAVPWRDLQWALRRLEARGTVLGGRFVTGFSGEQYASAEAAEQLRKVARSPHDDPPVRVNAVDPLNLVGILTPGPRVPAQRRNWITWRNGIPDELAERSHGA